MLVTRYWQIKKLRIKYVIRTIRLRDVSCWMVQLKNKNMMRKKSLLRAGILLVLGVTLWCCHKRKEPLVLEYSKHLFEKAERVSFRYKGLDSIYARVPFTKICFIGNDDTSVATSVDSIVYVTKTDSIRDLLTQKGFTSICLSESAYPYMMDDEVPYLWCRVDSVYSQSGQNVYRLHK